MKLDKVDPYLNGFSMGKAKRITRVLNWALENDHNAGENYLSLLLSTVRGQGGFENIPQTMLAKILFKTFNMLLKGRG